MVAKWTLAVLSLWMVTLFRDVSYSGKGLLRDQDSGHPEQQSDLSNSKKCLILLEIQSIKQQTKKQG